MSFMGKGVTKAATLCLRHLVYEMATLSDDQVFCSVQEWISDYKTRHSIDLLLNKKSPTMLL